MAETNRAKAEANTAKLAALMAEVMNLAAMVRRGDDAAWSGIGPDARARIASELMQFAELAARSDGAPTHGVCLHEAAEGATLLGDEIMRTGIPVSDRAQDLASALLSSMGIGPDLLRALDGET